LIHYAIGSGNKLVVRTNYYLEYFYPNEWIYPIRSKRIPN